MFTVAAVIAGLRAAAGFARLFQDTFRAEAYATAADQRREGLNQHLYHEGLNRYAKSGYRKADGYDLDDVLDASLLGSTTLGVFRARDDRNSNTIDAIRRQLWLKPPLGGCARYEHDQYQRPAGLGDEIPGNPWFITTLWLAECAIARARDLSELHDALPYFAWCAQHGPGFRGARGASRSAGWIAAVGCPADLEPLESGVDRHALRGTFRRTRRFLDDLIQTADRRDAARSARCLPT
jgi:GH15 family glucan-1,4-alpha-glucosidase